jgi:CheY-like chemotaxis protein
MRILLVDDEVRLADGIRRGLEAERMIVDVAHDGVDGLARARDSDYDAIVLDVMMPGMSGYRVCQALRAEGDWTPVLFLTAKDGEWDEVEGLDTGGDDWCWSRVCAPSCAAGPESDPRCSRPATCGSIPRRAGCSAATSRSRSPRGSCRCSTSFSAAATRW